MEVGALVAADGQGVPAGHSGVVGVEIVRGLVKGGVRRVVSDPGKPGAAALCVDPSDGVVGRVGGGVGGGAVLRTGDAVDGLGPRIVGPAAAIAADEATIQTAGEVWPAPNVGRIVRHVRSDREVPLAKMPQRVTESGVGGEGAWQSELARCDLPVVGGDGGGHAMAEGLAPCEDGGPRGRAGGLRVGVAKLDAGGFE